MTDAKNRRRAERHPADKTITLVLDSDPSQIASGAFAVDLSELGARVRAQIRLEPGQLITVLSSGGSGPQIKSRVIWVSDEGEGCAAGVAFLQPIALSSLDAEMVK